MRRLLTLVTVLVTTLLVLVTSTPPVSAATPPTEGVLRVGMEAAYAPFNWAQARQNNYTHPIANATNMFADGYDVQIAIKMAAALNMELEIHSISWGGLIPALTTGQIDAIIAGMTATDARRETIDFTDTYWTSDIVGLVHVNSPFANATTVAELNGARAVAQLGTIYDQMYNQIPNGIQVPALDDYAALSAAIIAGTADIVIGEYPVIALAAAANSNLTYITFTEGNGFVINRADGTTATRADVAIGVRQSVEGSPDRVIRDTMNQVLAGLTSDDRYLIMDAAITRHAALENPPIHWAVWVAVAVVGAGVIGVAAWFGMRKRQNQG